MRRDIWIPLVLWALSTLAALGVAAFLMNPFPTVGAEEAHLSDDAFMAMTYMAAPVFGLVMAGLAYTLWFHRSRGDPTDDGPPIQGTGTAPRVWLVGTVALAVVVMIYPGLTGLAELREDDTYELRVEVTGLSWQWLISYPGSDVRLSSNAGDELVLPDETRIRFDVEALDVLHSFWVPAFRQKIDAVPGLTTTVYVTTSGLGDPSDAAYRIQCAEICGLHHSTMAMPVRVVERAEFDAWLTSKGATAQAR